MKLVVSGYYGYGNTGDEAILAGMLQSLRGERDDLEFTVLSGDPALTERTHDVAAVPRLQPLAVAGALRAADGLISGGGSLLQDRTSIRPIAYYVGVMQLAGWLGRPYVVYAQGLGPIRWRANRRLAALALRRAGYVSLRDDHSIRLARQLGVHREIDLVPDPALALRPIGSSPGRHLLVAVRAFDTPLPYLASLRDALSELSVELPIVAVPMQGHADLAASCAVVAGIPGAEVLPPDATLAERLEAIGAARVVVGMRLHALVLAAGAGVRAVGISYDPKVDAFAAQVGQPIVGHVGEPLDPRDVVAAVRRELATNLGSSAERVEQMRGELHRAAVGTLTAIAGGIAGQRPE